ncbi:hypothetical protein L3V83_06885 [Thiotrichales bacterium 19X7-9]|nr:hypothetical protein [Thiotrichales bacterium 19X7-9]
MPKDVHSEFKSHQYDDESINYNYRAGSNYLEAIYYIDTKTITFSVKITNRNNISGSDLFSSLMRRLEKDQYEVCNIETSWVLNDPEMSTNTDKFITSFSNSIQKPFSQQILNDFPDEAVQAAKETWTGKQAAKFGFDMVKNTSYTNTISFTFSRPSRSSELKPLQPFSDFHDFKKTSSGNCVNIFS